MRARHARALAWMLLLRLSVAAPAADLGECLKLALQSDGSAHLANACASRLNVIYCIDHPDSPQACAAAALGVTTLFPAAHAAIPEYRKSAGPLYSAVCVYPEAPVGWKPGPDSPYSCKKTCVMC